MEALLDDFEQQVKSSALEEAIREMKEGSASDSDSTDNEEEDNDAMSQDDKQPEDGNMDVDQEQRIPDTKSDDKPSTFRDRYMGKVTQAFSTDLDKIRQVRMTSSL